MRLLTLPLPASRCASPSLLFELPSRCCLEEAPFPPPFSLGLLSAERVPEAAELLVDAFFLAPADGAADGPRAPPGKAAATREERLRLTARGLEWRLGSRLHAPDISLSLESSLLLALKDEETDKLAACAELSLRPREPPPPPPPPSFAPPPPSPLEGVVRRQLNLRRVRHLQAMADCRPSSLCHPSSFSTRRASRPTCVISLSRGTTAVAASHGACLPRARPLCATSGSSLSSTCTWTCEARRAALAESAHALPPGRARADFPPPLRDYASRAGLTKVPQRCTAVPDISHCLASTRQLPRLLLPKTATAPAGGSPRF